MFCYYGRLEYDLFALFALLPTIIFFSFLRYVSLLRVPSSVQQSYATRSPASRRWSCVSCLISEFVLLCLSNNSIVHSSQFLVGVFIVLSCPVR